MSDTPGGSTSKGRGRSVYDSYPLIIGPTRKINPEKIPEWELEIYQLDVGQGDAALLIFSGKNPKNHQLTQKVILIDAGEKNNSEHIGKILDQKFKSKNDKKIIDAVIITHNHSDHFGGATNLNEYYKSNTIFFGRNNKTMNKTEYNITTPELGKSIWEYLDINFYNENKDKFFNFFENLKTKNSIPNLIFCAFNKDSIRTKLEKNQKNILRAKTSEENLCSIACLISLKEFNFYTSGDIGGTQDEDMGELFREYEIIISARKVAHHLSDTGSNQNIDNLMQTPCVVASFGKNDSYGFPHEEAIKNIDNSINVMFAYTTNPSAHGELTKKFIISGNNQKISSPTKKEGYPPIKNNTIGLEVDKKTNIEKGHICIYTNSRLATKNKFEVTYNQINTVNNNLLMRVTDYYIRSLKLEKLKTKLENTENKIEKWKEFKTSHIQCNLANQNSLNDSVIRIEETERIEENSKITRDDLVKPTSLLDSFNSVEKETPPCGYSQKPAKPITLQHTDTDTKNEKQENKEETKEYSADDLAEYLKKSHISISKIKNTQNKSDGRQ